MKRLFLFFTLLALYVSVHAQSKGKVTFTLVDEVSKQAVIGAVVEVYPTATPDNKRYYTSNVDGTVTFPALSYGDYTMLATCLGYADLTKTFKVKVKTKKYTITLKNNKGKVMKKAKLTLKVGKKTYKATTNSKGKATFKITKLTKKGKYTATIKFAGSKYYKALSKKAKITVKK